MAAVHRLIKPLAFLVVVAQLLLAVPAQALTTANMAATTDDSAMAAMPCDDCPCCPDGMDSMTDCLVSCTLAAAAPLQPVVPVLSVRQAPATPAPAAFASTRFEPPLKPPPIA